MAESIQAAAAAVQNATKAPKGNAVDSRQGESHVILGKWFSHYDDQPERVKDAMLALRSVYAENPASLQCLLGLLNDPRFLDNANNQRLPQRQVLLVSIGEFGEKAIAAKGRLEELAAQTKWPSIAEFAIKALRKIDPLSYPESEEARESSAVTTEV